MDQSHLAALTAEERARLLRRARAAGVARTAGPAPLGPREGTGPVPLSAAQERMWFLCRLDEEGAAAYQVSSAVRLRGEADLPALRRALDALVARHEALRTTFRETPDGEPVQHIAESGTLELEVDASGDLPAALGRARSHRFRLDRGPLIRGVLVQGGAGGRDGAEGRDGSSGTLILTMHHIISDGWSLDLLLRELGALYGAFRKGEPDPLPPPPLQYGDYAVWQRRRLTGERLRKQEEFWRERLTGAPALCEVPTDRPRPDRQDHAGGTVPCRLEPDLAARLRDLARRHDTTLFVTLLAAWAAVLARISGEDEVVVGTPTANRAQAGTDDVVGLFVNTLALRLDTSGTPTVAEWLRRVKEATTAALAHQDLPFERVVDLVHPARSLAHSPLFQMFFAWQDARERTLDVPGLAPVALPPDPSVSAKFDLMLKLSDAGDRIEGGIEYAKALFDHDTVERYAGHWHTLLRGMADGDGVRLDALALTTPAEQAQILDDFNATAAPLPETCAHHVFEAHATATPEAIALVHQDTELTYAQLDARAARLAQRLRAAGVGPGDRVAIFLERGPDMVVSVLAVLKSGGAYVPLDPGYPEHRLAYMLADSAPVAVLTGPTPCALLDGRTTIDVTAATIDTAPGAGATATADDPAPGGATAPRPSVASEPDDTAYVIYTSGSTGDPKGVMVTHRGMVNLATWQRSAFGLDRPRRIAQLFSYSFDGAVGETVMALLNGGTLVMLDPADIEPTRLVAALNRHRINVVVSVPSLLRQVDASRLTGGRDLIVVSVGEACTKELAAHWSAHVRFMNGYGPTEYTVYSHLWEAEPGAVTAHERMPIGTAVHNTHTYVLDRAGNIQPIGVAGHIHLSGSGIARGYLGRPADTAGRFVPNPFALRKAVDDRGPLRLESALAAIERFAARHEGARPVTTTHPVLAPAEILDRVRGLDDDLLDTTRRFLDRNADDRAAHAGFCRYFLEGENAAYQAAGLDEHVLRTLLGDLGGLTGVELGCGNGEVLRTLAAAGAKAVGIDLSPFFVQALRRDGLDARHAQADVEPARMAEEFGIAEGSLDFALSTMVLDRTHHPRHLLANMMAVLRPGGRFALQTILPVVPLDDGEVSDPLVYTDDAHRIAPGRDAAEDRLALIAELRALGATGITLRTLPYIVASSDGVQRYELYSFSGVRGRVGAAERAYDLMYRTGDIGRRLPDGNLDFLGRDDFQVKVRGFRVEPAEIERRLTAHPGVRQAAVVADGERLLAYVVSAETPDTLRAHAAAALPEHMVPAAYVAVPELPLTPNGKLDRAALPEPDASAHARSAYTAPRGEIEEHVAAVWSDLLGVERVGRRDGFFALGGHSLVGVRVVARLREALGVEVPLGAVFAAPTLAAFARSVAAAPPVTLPPLEPAPPGTAPVVSAAQRRLWLLSGWESGGHAYHIRWSARLDGPLDAPALRRALDRILERHTALRTTFQDDDGTPVARIGGAGFTWTAPESVDDPFDLATGPLIRGSLVQDGDDSHTLVLVLHHIVADGLSLRILVRELGALYTAFSRGEPDPLPLPPVQYTDYAHWQQERLAGAGHAAQARYWRTALAGAPALCDLPTDRSRPARPDYAGGLVDLTLAPRLAARVREFSARHGVTPFTTLLASWAATLTRLSGQTEVVIGTPVAGRDDARTEDLIGFFVNMLPLRLDTSTTPTLGDWLNHVRDRVVAAQTHQDLPFDRIVDAVGPARSADRHPLFQTGFTWQHEPEEPLILPGVQVRPGPAPRHTTSRFDLTLALTETADGRIRGAAEYATALFDAATVRRFTDCWLTLLDAMTGQDAHTELAALPLLGPDAAEIETEGATLPHPADTRRVDRLVDAWIARTPDATALVHGDRVLSYADLGELASRHAEALRAHGIGPGDRVALVLPRSAELVALQLAVLRVGAVFVPGDPAHPQARRDFMVADSGAKLLVTEDGWTATGAPDTPPVPGAAYIMYTSGSTGTPKGVIAPHSGIIRLALPGGYAEFGPDDRTAFAATPAFDAATVEVWAPLLTGGRIVVVDREDLLDPPRLARTLDRHGITVLFLTTSLFQRHAEYGAEAARALARLRCLLVGGDVMDPARLRAFLTTQRPGRFVHVYGPTETTTFALAHIVQDVPADARRVPLGRPIERTTAHILDSRLRPVPAGVPGEIVIGGDGVCLGYLDRPDLTAEKFVTLNGHRCYRTGDRGRRLADGTIEFLGRTDAQIKIRGFRVEPGETETLLAQVPGIRDGAVLARDNGTGDKELIAYYVADAPVPAAALRDHLAAHLPDHQVPSAYVHLPALPLTPNGKIDRAALPAVHPDAYARHAHEAPEPGLEEQLAAVWSEVLGQERVGRHDDFFALGGHSLLAVRILSRLRSDLGVEVALSDLFDAPTLAGFAATASVALPARRPAIRPVPRGDGSPVSFAQRRLWFLSAVEGAGRAYHIPFGLRLTGALDTTALRRALDRIVDRHEILRTVFDHVDGEPVQRVRPAAGFPLTEQEASAAELPAVAAEEALAPFDLASGPLVRGRLVRLAERDHALLITMHHIISDGWSLRLLLSELATLYGAFSRGDTDPLPPLPVQYGDYAAWQHELAATGALADSDTYWQRHLHGAPELLELPTDRPRPARQDHSGAVVECALDPELTARLDELSRRHGTTLYMTLLAGWAAAVAGLSGHRDVVIGSPAAHRGQREAEDLIGFFVNTLPIRLDAAGSQTVTDWLAQVKERVLAAQAHQDVPFERIVELVRPARSLSHGPLIQVEFVFQSVDDEGGTPPGLPGLRTEPLPPAPHLTSQFDFSLKLTRNGDRVGGGVEFATALYDPDTVRRYLGHWQTLLTALVADDHATLDSLPLLTADEEKRVLALGTGPEKDSGPETSPGPGEPALAHLLIEAQARRTPHAPAALDCAGLDCAGLDYAALDAWANQIAHRLRALGVGRGDLVGLHARRGPAALAGLLGVLKASAAYVPLDPGYPAARLELLLRDTAPAAVLDDGSDTLPTTAVPVVGLDRGTEPEDAPPTTASPDDLAYVLHTSGSTGTPKGVAVAHRALTGYLRWAADVYRPVNGAAVSSSLSFDATVTSLLLPLVCGGPVRFVPEGAEVDGLRELIRDPAARGLLKITPAHLDALGRLARADGGPVHVDTLVVGGEALPAATVELWRRLAPDARIFNEYGPTEAVVGCVLHEVTGTVPGRPVPIGRPAPGTSLYVLDERGRPVPPGVTGQFHIGGAQLARGYLGRPDLTAERFHDTHRGRLYATGDLGRMLPDGTLEYLGRADDQIKLRGFRVEPGEIRAHLLALPGIREAAVAVREDAAGERHLTAYYSAADGTPDPRAALAGTLPEHLVPTALLRLDALPLTPNGKTDLAALPDPDPSAFAAGADTEPEGPVEAALAEIWAELLGRDGGVGRTDNFFTLGGHSLLAVTMLERMRLRGLHVDVGAVFTAPDLAALAAQVTVAETPREQRPDAPLDTLPRRAREAIEAAVPGGAPNVQDVYPLAPMQEGVLFHHLLTEEGDPYLLTVGLSFDSRDLLDRYLAAFRAVAARHDILRTSVMWEDLPEPMQVVWREAPLPVTEVTVDPDRGPALEQLRRRYDPRHHRIDVRRAPMLRMYAAAEPGTADQRWVLLMVSHHLMDDNTTFRVLFDEIRTFLRGEEAALPDPVPFGAFVRRAREEFDVAGAEAFFGDMLGDVTEPTTPFGLTAVDGDGREVAEHTTALDPDLAAVLRARARALGVTPAAVFHLAWAQVLARAAGRPDVVFGTVLSGRLGGADRAVGPTINTLPLRVRVDERSARTALLDCQAGLAALLGHEHAPLALAQRVSGVQAPTPLFTALLNYRHGAPRTPDDGWQGIHWEHAEERTNYPLMLAVDDLDEEFHLTVQAAGPAEPARIAALVAHAARVLTQALEERPDTPLAELDVLPEAERADVLHRWAGPTAAYPDLCLHELVEAQVRRTPDAVAVTEGTEQLTYAELDARAEGLAARLLAAGVRPDDRVGVHAERSASLVVALLGVLKAGAAYLPLEPDNPAERLAFLVRDGAPAAVLTDREGVSFPGVPVLDIRRPGPEPDTFVRAAAGPGNLAYVIHTSGSTGTPKGVMVEHRSVVNRLLWMQDTYRLGADERVLQKTPYGFDVSVWEFFWPLINGARLVLARPGGHRDPAYLAELIQRERITTVHFVPSMLRAFLADPAAAGCTGLRRVLCSGEALSDTLAADVHRLWPGTELHNLYGPTETAVDVTAQHCPPGRPVTLGLPVANTRVYVVDERGRPAPVGAAGELWVGGVQVARGYLGRPELTGERFLDDPFTGNGRVYRTGDLARRLPDGTLEYLGRADFQLKVRGIRVEPGEIEAALAALPGVRDSVVTACGDALVAYVTGDADPTALRAALAATLPDHLVPSAYVHLEALPLTVSGKVDRAALPAPDGTVLARRPYEAPEGETEKALAAIWADLLGLDRVGRHDGFFGLGGHSLLAVTLMERMRQAAMPVDVRTLYQAPTLAELARALGGPQRRAVIPPNLIPDPAATRTESGPTVELTL
ncbi:non-ribosomal peptide synthetase [Streptomyces sp. NBC_00525]|uniref:non-ribosomal peptide synthetase n=1 Tax=Streptomyces sp. NBC_00525 TaxID=2903660 RepID=UPI002E824217|nr:amino acid adenylation domain-containing protein [Streptomyces sp. NBC_00525]WUC96547.1 amino acid adenylation domain-containing protein [Streptomyces sp. NBC_00525]